LAPSFLREKAIEEGIKGNEQCRRHLFEKQGICCQLTVGEGASTTVNLSKGAEGMIICSFMSHFLA
jgi:hypothetical protein